MKSPSFISDLQNRPKIESRKLSTYTSSISAREINGNVDKRSNCGAHDTKSFLSPHSNMVFTKKKSCTTELPEFLEDLTEGLDNVKDVDIVHLDF